MLSSEIRKLARENLVGRWKQAVIIAIIFCLITGIITYINNLSLHMPVVDIIISIALLAISIPLSFGFSGAMIKFKRKEDVEVVEPLTYGFSKFGRAWAVTGYMILKMIVPFVFAMVFLALILFSGVSLAADAYLFINGGAFTQTMLVHSISYNFVLACVGAVGFFISFIFMIPKIFLYALSYFIAIDNPDMSAKASVEKSAELMKGNRWKLFCLYFSFIGWMFLTGVVAGCITPLLAGVPALAIIITPVFNCFVLPYIMIATIIFYENLAGKLNTVEVKAEPATPVVEEAKPQEEVVKVEEPVQNNEETEEPIQETNENSEDTNE